MMMMLFFPLSLSHCCCVIAVHHNPYCAYVVHPHCFRIHFISLLHSSLFVCLLSENFDFFFSLSHCMSLLSPHPFSEERHAAAPKIRLCKFTSASELLSNKHKACELICQFVRFRNVNTCRFFCLFCSIAWCCELRLIGSLKLNGKLHKNIFLEFMWKPCTRERHENVTHLWQKYPYIFICTIYSRIQALSNW